MKKLQHVAVVSCFILSGILGSAHVSMAGGALQREEDHLASQPKNSNNTSGTITKSDGSPLSLNQLSPEDMASIENALSFAREVGINDRIVGSVKVGGETDLKTSGDSFKGVHGVPVVVGYRPGTTLQDITSDQAVEVRNQTYGSRGLREATAPEISGSFQASTQAAADSVELQLNKTAIGYERNGKEFVLGGLRRRQAEEIIQSDPGFRTTGASFLSCTCALIRPNAHNALDSRILVHYATDSKTAEVKVLSPR